MSPRCIVAQGHIDSADNVVVFLPPAGYATSPYFAVGTHLPASLPALHCELPGRGRFPEMTSPATVAEAVDNWADDLRSEAVGRRIHLFGHSLGALYAFELASDPRLGDLVRTLMVSAARPPAALGSTERMAELLRSYVNSTAEVSNASVWLTHDLAIRSNYRYRGQETSAALALFCAREDPLLAPEETLGWTAVTTGKYCGQFIFDGGHLYFADRALLLATTINYVVNSNSDCGQYAASAADARGNTTSRHCTKGQP
jgi:surfactin synthase thioesterase subunit